METETLLDVFEIDESSSTPIWLQLKNRILYLISSGYFKPGDKLPTVRELAVKLKINYNTVNKVYLSLLHDGYLLSRRGNGTFVRDLSKTDLVRQDSPADTIIDMMIKQCLDVGVPLDGIVGQVQKCVDRQRALRENLQEDDV